MTPPSHGGLPPAHFRQLVDSLLSETLSEEGLQQLEQQLDGNPGLQEYFRNYCQLHLDLVTDIRSQCVVDEVSQFISHKSKSSSADRRLRGLRGLLLARHTSTASFYIGVAASLVVALSAALVAHFSSTGEPLVGDTIAEGDVISVNLTSHEYRSLPIGDVGTVLIQGPAHFELIGNRRAKLHQGRIKVRIDDEQGHGFVVETPRGHVTDLGTEFGVDVAKDSSTGVFVFEGEVDLTLPDARTMGGLQVERLIQGDGLALQHSGRLDRIMSVVTGNVATFQRLGEMNSKGSVITGVTDNIRQAGFRKFYEIVPGGLGEDALCYADRPAHDWNGVDESGMPDYLIGADYVKPFNSDKMRADVEIKVTLSQPARLLIFFDRRVSPPAWLTESFHDTGDVIGMDLGPYVLDGVHYDHTNRNFGPGKSIQHTFSIWEQIVDKPGVVQLGPNFGNSELTAMYGIAAIPYEGPGKPERRIQTNTGL